MSIFAFQSVAVASAMVKGSIFRPSAFVNAGRKKPARETAMDLSI